MMSNRLQRLVSSLLAASLALAVPGRAFAGPGAVSGALTQAFGNKPLAIVNPQEGDSIVLSGGKWVRGSPSITSSSLDAAFGTTQGSVIYRGASGWVSLGPGSSGQLLTSGGPSANVSWTSVSTSQTLAQTLAQGFVTGANNIQVTIGQLIQFGGATSSFPALRRNGTNGILESRLADDSAGAVFGATELWVGGAGSYDVGLRRVSGGKLQITDTSTTDRDLQAANIALSGATGLTLSSAPGADTCIVTADQTHSGGSFTFLWLGAAGSRSTGLYQSSAGVLNVTDTGATNYATLGNGGIRLQAAGVVGFSATSDATAAADTAFSRGGSAATSALGNGSPNDDSGTLRLTKLAGSSSTTLTVQAGGSQATYVRGGDSSVSTATPGDAVVWGGAPNNANGSSVILIARDPDGAGTTGGNIEMRFGITTLPANSGVVKITGSDGVRYYEWSRTGVTRFAGLDTQGMGVPAICASARQTGKTAALSNLINYTVPSSGDGTFEVVANVRPTTSTSHSFTVTCSYTDEQGTARTVTLPFVLVAGSAIVNTVVNTNGVVPYMGIPIRIRAQASSSITVQTTGTFTTVTYNVEADIKRAS
jgi:hypothetical protein